MASNSPSVSESDENDQSLRKPDLNSKKGSKGIGAIKKILAERNKDSELIVEKSPNLDSKSVVNSQELLSQPYDPSSNYLSPRPKFLRYNPNRRQEILQRREEETTVSAHSSVDSSSHSGYVEQQDEEFNYSDEVMEEFEEERCWGLKGVLKGLILIVVLVFSTLYISTMNSAAPFHSPALQAFVGLRNGCLEVQNYVLGLGDEKRIHFYGERDASMEENQSFTEEGVEEEEIEEFGNMGKVDFVELNEGKPESEETVEIENMGSIEIVGLNVGEQENEVIDEYENMVKVESLELNEVETENKEIVEFENMGSTEIVELNGEIEVEELENGEGEEIDDQKMVKTDLAFQFVIGISILFVITTSLILGFYFKRKKDNGINSPLSLKPHSESTITEKISCLIPTEKDGRFEASDDIVISHSLLHSTIDDSKKFDYTSAPSVELLSEFEIHSAPFDSEPSAMNSPSFSSFTPKKNIFEKEEDEDVRKVKTPTPVRRSSRIRNRGVMSP